MALKENGGRHSELGPTIIGVEFYLARGGGGWVHIQIPVSWVGGGKHCKLHAFVHISIEGT